MTECVVLKLLLRRFCLGSSLKKLMDLSGELSFNIFSALAQFERRLIQDRMQAGLAESSGHGRVQAEKRLTDQKISHDFVTENGISRMRHGQLKCVNGAWRIMKLS